MEGVSTNRDECNGVEWILSPLQVRGFLGGTMGYIYKITNKLNDKVYIGQTVKSCQKRWTQHKNNSNKEYFSQIVLYKAFNKYGIENFNFEEIEEVPNEELDEREKYWIEYYDSYFNGYNSTLGGRATKLYDWDVDDIIEKYMILKSARKVAEVIGCDHSSIDRILNENGVKRFTPAEQQSKAVRLQKGEEIKDFPTTTAAAEWMIANKIVSTNNVKNVRRSITEHIIKNKTYFDYKISYI